MRIDDERDPLDTWLDREVRPLPPPPGTFELITRRARRRKMRKLAVTVASTVAVAAGVAVAVPNVMALRLSPNPTTAGPVAAGSSATPSGGTESQNGTATHYASPTPPVSSSASSLPTAPSGGPVPKNFQPSSVTFVNTRLAWVIGQAGTPGKCQDKNPYFCTSIARTGDAGQTWVGGPAPKTGPPSGASGVSGIRFLDGINGWAFGPELWSTHDAGVTWNQIDTQGERVTDLETAGGWAFALFATCKQTPGIPQFNWYCTRYTLKTTPAGTDNWKPVGGATSGLTAGGNPTSAVIALTSTTGYLLAPDGTLYFGAIGSPWARVGTAPCQPGVGQANGQPVHALLGLVNATYLAIACTGFVGVPTQVWQSNDNGADWAKAPAPAKDRVNSLAAAPGGTIVMATAAGIEVLQAGSAQWQMAKGAPPGGFSYVGMTTDTQGVALPFDMQRHEIWMTSDGGLTWAPTTPLSTG
jgi:hypothetical protein